MPNQIADGLKNMDINAIGRQSTMSPPQQSHQYPHASSNEGPHLSPFPKLVNPPPNVPPSDDELEVTLENARPVVLNSNDPEMQLAWAADALIYVGVCADNEERTAAAKPQAARSTTPRVEHQLKEDAMNVVTFLADQHHPKAEFLRGMWLEWGRFGQREDKKEAFRCYSRAADKQYSRAEYRIGMLYESYNDPVKALRHYHRGVDAGDAASCYRLGMMTLRGQHGQQQDFARGIELIKKSADGADENAAQGAYVYGMLLARQLPQIEIPDGYLEFDERKARMNIEKAAYLKFAKAQLKMGSAYELGSLGCEFNPALSVHYNALASKQGEAEADMSLSKWFLVGSEGLFPKNEELAYTYAERATQSGLATAEFALGYFHEIGMYVPVNLDKAMEWYQKASKHGNEDATGRIEGLSRKQILSRKDHEQVAVSRIKSQHGSMRGVRPDRFQQQQRPSRLGQSTTIDEVSQSYSNGNAAGGQVPPPRGSSITPYPEDDRPPTIPPNNRPQSVTPYPVEDGPPQSQRPGPAGGFFNVSQPPRPSTTLNPDNRPSSAFQINPELRPNSISQLPSYAGRPNYYGGPPPAGTRPGTTQPYDARPATTQPYDARPATTQPYDPRLRPPAANRVASGPPGMQNYPPQQGRPSPAPQRPPMQQQNSSPAAPQQPPQPPQKLDIGFSAPVDDRRNRQYGPSPRPGQPPSNQPLGLQHPQTMPVDKPVPLAPSAKPYAKPPEGKKPDVRPPPKDSGPKPMPVKASTAPAKPPGKGPKTFDEMGVPAQQKDGECVSRFLHAFVALFVLTVCRL
jgi:TPR repeat protein